MALFHPMHLALVVLLVFGPRKLPELARGVGEALRELQQTLHDGPEPEPGAAPASAANSTPAASAPSRSASPGSTSSSA
jgi:sec-independent protein translocase protein TatA